MIFWMQKPSTQERALTAAQVAGLFAASLLAMPVLERASVMNCLLHRHPRAFATLLLREPRENPGRFQCPL